MGIRDLLKRLPGIGSLGRGDHTLEGDRPVENIDAMGAAYARDLDIDASGDGGGGGIPPNYVKSYDEGRPRK
jgi:hypothetical protein